MRLLRRFLALAAAVALVGCAASSKETASASGPETTAPAQTEQAQAAPATTEQAQAAPAAAEQPVPPEPREGEALVFGRVQLFEYVNKIPMPAPDNSGKLLISEVSGEKTYEIKSSKAGDFGVYLPHGEYKLVMAKIDGYLIGLDIALKVNDGRKAIYAGTVAIDGTPTGIDPEENTTHFVFTVKDEFKDFIAEVKKTRPEVEEMIAKSMFTPKGGLATGRYPNRVKRAKDVQNYLEGRSGALEEVATGVVVVIPYIANPLWLLAH